MKKSRRTKRTALGRRELAGLALLAAVVFGPAALSTESLTLTTYYPSPYGVYNEMRTTGNALLAYSGGAVGVGTTSPSAKLDVNGSTNISGTTVIGGNTTVNADAQIQRVGVNGAINDIYATGISVTGKNIHVQGNENSQWLRVGDAWSMNGIYSEAGDVVVGAATGKIHIGADDSQYLANSCRAIAYSFGTSTYCPNGGQGWSAIGSSGSAGIIDYTMPTSGYMYCCKLEQY